MRDHISLKLARAISTSASLDHNRRALEWMWYEVWSLWLAWQLLERPNDEQVAQAALYAFLDGNRSLRIPDFVVMRYVYEGIPLTLVAKRPIATIEVKPWRSHYVDQGNRLNFFNYLAFQVQVRNQAKYVFASDQNIHRVCVIQAVGDWWRVTHLDRHLLSPISQDQEQAVPSWNIAWSPIVQLRTQASTTLAAQQFP